MGKFNTYNELRLETVGLENKVLRQEKTKATALEEMNTVLEAQDEAFTSIKAFFSKEPGEGAFNGCILLFGNNFVNGVGMGDLNALVGEAGDQEQQAVMRIAANIQVMADVPDLMD